MLLQDYQRQMQKLDGEMTEVNEWIDGAERKMEEMDREGPNDAVLKVLYIFNFSLLLSIFPDFFPRLLNPRIQYFVTQPIILYSYSTL